MLKKADVKQLIDLHFQTQSFKSDKQLRGTREDHEKKQTKFNIGYPSLNRFANLYKSPSRQEMTVPFQITVQ